MTPSPTAALILIGNELLSGRTRDVNLAHLAQRLGSRGIRLVEARVIADDATAIVAAVNALRARCDHVFTTGGIGPTHDDITADCIAKAFGVGIGIDPEARRRLESFWREHSIAPNEERLRMARVPDGARLIENDVSAAPGFTLENVHVMAGVPRIMQSMLEQVLPLLPEGPLTHSVSVVFGGVGEGDIAAPLRVLQERFPAVDLGSYPGRMDGQSRIELVARGQDKRMVSDAGEALAGLVQQVGGTRCDP